MQRNSIYTFLLWVMMFFSHVGWGMKDDKIDYNREVLETVKQQDNTCYITANYLSGRFDSIMLRKDTRLIKSDTLFILMSIEGANALLQKKMTFDPFSMRKWLPHEIERVQTYVAAHGLGKKEQKEEDIVALAARYFTQPTSLNQKGVLLLKRWFRFKDLEKIASQYDNQLGWRLISLSTENDIAHRVDRRLLSFTNHIALEIIEVLGFGYYVRDPNSAGEFKEDDVMDWPWQEHGFATLLDAILAIDKKYQAKLALPHNPIESELLPSFAELCQQENCELETSYDKNLSSIALGNSPSSSPQNPSGIINTTDFYNDRDENEYLLVSDDKCDDKKEKPDGIDYKRDVIEAIKKQNGKYYAARNEIKNRLDSIMVRENTALYDERAPFRILDINAAKTSLKEHLPRHPRTFRPWLKHEIERMNIYIDAHELGERLDISDPTDQDIARLAAQYFSDPTSINLDGVLWLKRWFRIEHIEKMKAFYEDLNWYPELSLSSERNKKNRIDRRLFAFKTKYNELKRLEIIGVTGFGYYLHDALKDGEFLEGDDLMKWSWEKFGHATLLDALLAIEKNSNLTLIQPKPFLKIDPHPLFTALKREPLLCDINRADNYVLAKKVGRYYALSDPSMGETVSLFEEYLGDGPSMTQDAIDWLSFWFGFLEADELFSDHHAHQVESGELKWFIGPLPSIMTEEGLMERRTLWFIKHDTDGNVIYNADGKFIIIKWYISHLASRGYLISTEPIESANIDAWHMYGYGSLFQLLEKNKEAGLHLTSVSSWPAKKGAHPIFNIKSSHTAYEQHLQTAIKNTAVNESHMQGDLNRNNMIEMFVGPEVVLRKERHSIKGGTSKVYHIEKAHQYYLAKHPDGRYVNDLHPFTSYKIKEHERDRVAMHYERYRGTKNGTHEINQAELDNLWDRFIKNTIKDDERKILAASLELNPGKVVSSFEPNRFNEYSKIAEELLKKAPQGSWFLRTSSLRRTGPLSVMSLSTVKKDIKLSHQRIMIVQGNGCFMLKNDGTNTFFASIVDAFKATAHWMTLGNWVKLTH